jgi:hypothetical protein
MSGPNNLDALERAACNPVPVDPSGFNPAARMPYGLQPAHIQAAMSSFVDVLGFINGQLHSNGIERLESMLMPANFSSVVGEFVISNIPRHCATLAKNRYHNGHPDLVPAGRFLGNAVQHATEGIEIKASRYRRGWQGHNPEDTWLLVFVFDSNRPADAANGIPPRPFRFVMVAGAQLAQADWRYSGRSETSRRTITASVARSGYDKLIANWIYRAPSA